MDKKKLDFLKSKQTYLRFIYKITEHINSGKKPPAEMIEQIRHLGRQVNIPEEELKNLGIVSYYWTRPDGKSNTPFIEIIFVGKLALSHFIQQHLSKSIVSTDLFYSAIFISNTTELELADILEYPKKTGLLILEITERSVRQVFE